jgi:FK506-binding nuclear protein
VCALVGGRCETSGLDLVLDEYVEFTVEGEVGVDLTGYYMPEFGEEMGAYDDEEDDDDGLMYDDEDDSEDDDDDDDDALMMGDSDDDDDEDEDDDSEDDEEDSEDDEEDSEDEDDSEEDESEDEGVTRKGGVQIQEIEEKKPAQKRPAESKPAKTPEPKKQAVAKEAPKKPDTPKRVHKNGMEIINTHATKNAKAKVAAGGKKVAMKYIGKLPSGKIFDQTKGNATFTFRLGVGEVIRGWDVGVEGMREGDKRTLIIPAAMGYGKKGIKGVIPGGSALHFDVELVKVF